MKRPQHPRSKPTRSGAAFLVPATRHRQPTTVTQQDHRPGFRPVHRVLTIGLGPATGGSADGALPHRLPVTTPRRGQVPALLALLAMLALGPAACGSASNIHDNANCGQTSTSSRLPKARGPRTGPAGGSGSASQAPHTAPPPTAPPSKPPPPTPVNGQISITAANAGQTIVVPAGTLIVVRLEPVSGAMWTVPESSDPHALPRLSASGPCDAVKTATFRADGDGAIDATHPQGDALGGMVLTVRISG